VDLKGFDVATVSSYVDGAEVAFAGGCPSGPGFWYPPTVLLAQSTADRHWLEETFGPVVSVLPFDDEAEAVALANDTEYGLSGSIWNRDVGRAVRAARGVESVTEVKNVFLSTEE
jgi:acyl-CoA reductase-like NAD-dependent aldehyde dehydrogenase